MNRADEARRQAPQHGRLRAHRPAAPARSSPEAIYRSLVRRAERLERRKQELITGGASRRPEADELDRRPRRVRRRRVLGRGARGDRGGARRCRHRGAHGRGARRRARSTSRDLIELAELVRAAETDRKWSELRTILEDNTLGATNGDEPPRKLIIFTEHRDTLDYLARRIGSLLGRPRGGRRDPRRRAPQRASPDHRGVHQQPGLPDPAGHRRRRRGPQPPGRAPDGQLRPALEPEPDRAALRPHPPHRPDGGLPPLEPRRQRHPRGRGLHSACSRSSRSSARPTAARSSTSSAPPSSETPLRELLIEAIRYGEQPEVQGEDAAGHRRSASPTGIEELLDERALATGGLMRG